MATVSFNVSSNCRFPGSWLVGAMIRAQAAGQGGLMEKQRAGTGVLNRKIFFVKSGFSRIASFLIRRSVARSYFLKRRPSLSNPIRSDPSRGVDRYERDRPTTLTSNDGGNKTLKSSCGAPTGTH